MKYIDLHVHSNTSDGTFTPTELVIYADKIGLSAFALTDHDTVAGVGEAIEVASSYNLEVISGIELSAFYTDRDIHILGLYVDHTNESFNRYVRELQELREERNHKMIDKLALHGVSISMDKLRKSKDFTLTRAHFAKYLTEQGYTKNYEEAFHKYIGKGNPCYVPKQYISPEHAISLIIEAKGIPILAHPLLYGFTKKELDTLVSYLKSLGLRGIEAIYSANNSNDEIAMKRLAYKYNLLISGGSDFHGANKPHLDMGVGKGNLKVPYSVLENLKNNSLL